MAHMQVFRAKGQTAAAELVGAWAPSSFWDSHEVPVDEDCPVLIGEFFPFPNPMSVPSITVTVFEPASLVIVLVGEGGRTLDDFLFEGVERGAYYFRVDAAVSQGERARLRVGCMVGGESELEVPRSTALGIK
jgi:hypothetical protein